MTAHSPKPHRPPYPRRYITPVESSTEETPKKHESRFGSPLLGSANDTPKKTRTRIFLLLWALLSGAHLSGALACLLIISSIVPSDRIFAPDVATLTWKAVPAFIAISYIVGISGCYFYTNYALKWFVDEQPPTEKNRTLVLLGPRYLTLLQLILWLIGALIFGCCYGHIEPSMGLKVALTVIVGSIIMTALCFLASEFALRPAASVVLSHYGPQSRTVTGIASRMFLVWLAGTGLPILGLLLIGATNLHTTEFSIQEMSRFIVIIAVCVLLFSAVLNLQISTYITPPLQQVRHGMERVSVGDLDTEVAVFDGSEIGELQAGFNNMVHELREQQHIKDLFRQHVGSKIADQALSAQPEERNVTKRDASVFFIDIIGSTKLSLEYDSYTVVDLLNRFYTIVVEEVNRAGGVVNKFAGDAVLAIFNVPDDHPDPAGASLYCARVVMNRLDHELPEIAAAVGISAGRVVAGNIGSKDRYEYTVIGDPVNIASRLSELAKQEPGRILASQRTVNMANEEEAHFWMIDGATVLRGRSDATVLARPENPVVTSFALRKERQQQNKHHDGTMQTNTPDHNTTQL